MMAKPAKRFESCCGGLCGAGLQKLLRVLGGFKACPKRATQQFRSPIEKQLLGPIGRHHGKGSKTPRELLRRVVRC